MLIYQHCQVTHCWWLRPPLFTFFVLSQVQEQNSTVSPYMKELCKGMGRELDQNIFFPQIFCCDQQHNCKYNVSIIILASQISIYTDFMQWKLFLEKCDLSFMNRISASLCILVSIFSNYNFELNNPPPSQEKAYTCLLIQHIKKHFPATQN